MTSLYRDKSCNRVSDTQSGVGNYKRGRPPFHNENESLFEKQTRGPGKIPHAKSWIQNLPRLCIGRDHRAQLVSIVVAPKSQVHGNLYEACGASPGKAELVPASIEAACDILCTALEPILLERAHHEKTVGGGKKQGDLEIPLRGHESVRPI